GADGPPGAVDVVRRGASGRRRRRAEHGAAGRRVQPPRGVAEKALAMGRAGGAERAPPRPPPGGARARPAGQRLSFSLVDLAARFAAKLATATAKGAWADYVIELYEAQARPCPAPVVDELYIAFRKVNAIDLARLRGYLARLREKQATLGPAERFLLQRIEGLERLAALR